MYVNISSIFLVELKRRMANCRSWGFIFNSNVSENKTLYQSSVFSCHTSPWSSVCSTMCCDQANNRYFR